MRAAIETLGCKVNQYDSNAIVRLLKENGYSIVSPETEADVYIVNSCTVTAESSRKSRQALRRLRHLHPNAVTVLTGCYSQAYSPETERIPEADIILGNKTNDLLPKAVQTFLQTRERQICVTPHELHDAYDTLNAASFEGHTRAYIKIQDGCNRRCTYCIIPTSRGFSRSRSIESIADELKAISANGYKEVVFVGINLSAYGLDTGKSISDALELAQRENGIQRIRLGSLEPDHITDDVIRSLSTMTKFCPQFHLSLQSGSDTVLKRMNRHYNTSEYLLLCEKLKNAFPGLSLTTDVIVGFPGESERDFNDTVAFIKKVGFMKVHVFPYSPREGTPSASYEGQIDKQTKMHRCTFLQHECDVCRNGFLNEMQGTIHEVLFETPKNGFQQGYTKNYTPVYLKKVDDLTGRIRTVRISGYHADGCLCEIIEE